MTKRIVHYRLSFPPIETGDRAYLFPIDHDDLENVSNTMPAMTSRVVSWDKIRGVIETQNSIYYPEGFNHDAER